MDDPERHDLEWIGDVVAEEHGVSFVRFSRETQDQRNGDWDAAGFHLFAGGRFFCK